MTQRIGVYGGTFDPIHLGHLLMAETARDEASLDRVIFAPAGHPWHRSTATAAHHRLAMVRLATADNPAFDVSTVDIDRKGATYTVDTLHDLQQTHPDARLVFILGQDALNQIDTWREPARIARYAELLVMQRPDSSPVDLEEARRFLGPDAKMTFAPNPLIELSATGIRQRIAENKSVRYRIPEAVLAYIEENHLYGAVLGVQQQVRAADATG